MVRMRLASTYRLAIAAMAAAALCGCSTTWTVSSWASPQAHELTFKKIAVVCISQETSIRRAAEDALVKHIQRAEAVPSYTFITDSDLANDEKVLSMIKEAGFDGAVTMRVVGQHERVTLTTTTYPDYYRGYGSYHRATYNRSYRSTGMVVDEIVQVETNVYATVDGTLVWTSMTETMNPVRIEDAVDDIAAVIIKDMRKKGMLPDDEQG